MNKVADYLFYIEKPPDDKWYIGVDCTLDVALLASDEKITAATTAFDENGDAIAGILNGNPVVGTYADRTFTSDPDGRIVMQNIQAGTDQARIIIIFTVTTDTSTPRIITYGYVVDVVAFEIGD